MKRPWIIPIALAVLLGGLAWIASARLASNDPVRSGVLYAAGAVRSDPAAVLAPSLATTRTATSAAQPAIAGVLAAVEVSAGDHVSAGQVLARLDDRELALRVDAAKAAARGAKARVGVIDANLDTVASNTTKLADARRALDDALAKLRASRADVIKNLAAAEAAAATAPPVLPPGMPDPRAVVAKLKGALAQIDAGLAKAAAGRAKLDTGAAKLSDARSQLHGARGVLVLAADAAEAGVQVAEARRALTVVRAPYAGVVTWAAETGAVAFAGGPVARILPDGPVLLDTYLDAEQVKLLRVGSTATASSDSHPDGAYAGRVSAIRPVYGYPPTALPTSLIHMTRAFRVTVTLDDTAAPLPPGTPADLTISTRSGS